MVEYAFHTLLLVIRRLFAEFAAKALEKAVATWVSAWKQTVHVIKFCISVPSPSQANSLDFLHAINNKPNKPYEFMNELWMNSECDSSDSYALPLCPFAMFCIFAQGGRRTGKALHRLSEFYENGWMIRVLRASCVFCSNFYEVVEPQRRKDAVKKWSFNGSSRSHTLARRPPLGTSRFSLHLLW